MMPQGAMLSPTSALANIQHGLSEAQECFNACEAFEHLAVDGGARTGYAASGTHDRAQELAPAPAGPAHTGTLACPVPSCGSCCARGDGEGGGAGRGEGLAMAGGGGVGVPGCGPVGGGGQARREGMSLEMERLREDTCEGRAR